MTTPTRTTNSTGEEGAVTVLRGGATTAIARGKVTGDDVWLREADLLGATGWEVKPEGVCQGDVCVPVSEAAREGVTHEQAGERWISATGIARHVGQPYAQESSRRVWSFGPPAHEWQGRRGSDEAPGFTLPDFDGRQRSLSEFLGKKVFLLTWASW
jgi:hypothetical protein